MESITTQVEKLEVSMEDTKREIEVIEIELKNIKDSKIPEDIKREFSKRLESELVWLESISEDEKASMEFYEMKFRDEQVDNELEELKLYGVNELNEVVC